MSKHKWSDHVELGFELLRRIQFFSGLQKDKNLKILNVVLIIQSKATQGLISR